MVFFDPETDFIAGPWIMSEYGKKIDKKTVIIGYNVNYDGQKIKLFGEEFKVASKMAKTGTNLDNSVYFTFDSMSNVLEKAEEKGVFFTETQKGENIISSVYINVKQDYKVSEILKKCHLQIGDDFEVVYPKELSNSMEKNLSGINRLIDILVNITAVLLFIILFIIITISMNQRKREISLYRITGNSKIKIIKRLILEIFESSIVGSIIVLAIALLAAIYPILRICNM